MGTTRSSPQATPSGPSTQLWPSNGPQDWETVEMQNAAPEQAGTPGFNRNWALVAAAVVVVAVIAYIGYVRTAPGYPLGIAPVNFRNGAMPNGVLQNPLARNGQLNGAVPNGGAPNGPFLNGAVPNGAVPNGGAPNGPFLNGAVPNGAAPNGAFPNGAFPNGAAPNGAVPNGAVLNGAVPNGALPNGAAPGLGQPGLALAQPGAAQGLQPAPGVGFGQQAGGAPAQQLLPAAEQLPGGGARNLDWQAVTTAVQRSVVQVAVPGGQIATGVVIGRNGEIATVAHIFPAAAVGRVDVTMADGRVVAAQTLGVDRLSNLALLRIVDAVPQPIMIGDANAVRLGDPVLAVANQPGAGGAVSSGVVSGLHRLIGGVDPGNAANRRVDLVDAIQTDATLPVGAGGGALVDRNGRLVGIVVVSAGGGGTANGQVFAVPVNIVTTASTQLAATGQVGRTWLGVTVRESQVRVSPTVTVQAAVVTAVQPGSPAAAANFTPGDAVIAIDGVPVTSAGAFASRIFGLAAGGPNVTLTVVRNMQTFQVRLPLANRPVGQSMADAL